jgi:hypothetical protein
VGTRDIFSNWAGDKGTFLLKALKISLFPKTRFGSQVLGTLSKRSLGFLYPRLRAGLHWSFHSTDDTILGTGENSHASGTCTIQNTQR